MTLRAHAKINLALKIVGFRGTYHEIVSRFARVESLYDTIAFIPSTCSEFTLRGNFSCPTADNLITKAYHALARHRASEQLPRFFQAHAVEIEKKIPEGAGLGGGSANAGAFLRLCNEALELGLDVATLAAIGASIGADVPFFVHDAPAALVSGIGEQIEPLPAESATWELCTPPIHCDTAAVYRAFRRTAGDLALSQALAATLRDTPARTLLARHDAATLNDLYTPALSLYPGLLEYARDGWFFSGSGSTFFRLAA